MLQHLSSMHPVSQTLIVDQRDKRLWPGRVGHCGTLSAVMEQAFSFVCLLASLKRHKKMATRNQVRRMSFVISDTEYIFFNLI